MDAKHPPGLELDAFVAGNIMGWTYLELITHLPDRRRQLLGTRPIGEQNPAIAVRCKVPRYSTDFAAAWDVWERVRLWPATSGGEGSTRFGSITLAHPRTRPPDAVGRYATAVIGSCHPVEGIGDTLPHAMCLAILKALGLEVPA